MAVGNEVIVVGFEPSLGIEFALTVGGVGVGGVTLANLGVGLLFADSTHNAETTDIDKAIDAHL